MIHVAVIEVSVDKTSKIDYIKEFNTEFDANAFIKTFNAANDSEEESYLYAKIMSFRGV